MPEPATHRAEPARPPEPTPALNEARAERLRRRTRREALERVSVARGIIMLAVVALFASMLRAGWHRVFVHGWWRQW